MEGQVIQEGDGMQNNHKSQLDFERIQLLFASSRLTLSGAAICLLTMTLVVRASLPPSYYQVWFVAAVLSLLPRLYLSVKFNLRFEQASVPWDSIRKWEIGWAISSAPIAIAFVSLAFLPYEENRLVAVMFTGLVLLGMCAGSIISSNSSLLTVNVFFNLTCLPFIVRCFLEQSEVYSLLGVFFTSFYLIFLKLSRRLHFTVINSISLQIESRTNSLIDSLTGLWNRRGLFPYAQQLIKQSRRSREPFSVIMLDIDHFKQTNDTLGHKAGDMILVEVANCIRQGSREGDLLVRYGGEEFLMVLPGATDAQAGNVAQRINAAVRKLTESTISAGVACYRYGMGFDELVFVADKALYQAKEGGRDQVVVAEDYETNSSILSEIPPHSDELSDPLGE